MPRTDEARTRLHRNLLGIFIVEHVLLFAASVALLSWIVFWLGPAIHVGAIMSDGPEPPRHSDTRHPVLGWFVIATWLAPLLYSIVVPWRRRRLDGVSITGAVLTALMLLATGIAVRLVLILFAVYLGVVLLPAMASLGEDWAVRRAGQLAARR